MNSRTIQVLLVDDVAANQRAMERLLTRRGCDITLAADGREAVELAQDRPFDVILLDLQMPIMDGYEASRQIRALPRARARIVPIIAMSARGTESDQRDCLAAGMNGCLPKPVNMDELFAMLKQLQNATSPVHSQILGQGKSSDQSTAQAAKPLSSVGASENGNATVGGNLKLMPQRKTSASMPTRILDLEDTMRRLQGDLFILQMLVEQFEQHAESMVDEIRQSSMASDGPALAQTAHRLRGIAANLGALQLQHQAASIERAADLSDFNRTNELTGHLPALVRAVRTELAKKTAQHQSTQQ